MKIKFFRKKKINKVHNNFIILQFRKIIENRNINVIEKGNLYFLKYKRKKKILKKKFKN